MNTDAKSAKHVRSAMFNLPNQLTSLRLLLSVVMFGFITQDCYLTSFVLFVIAAGTDWLDGYYARKYGQVTTLGRILDPFADKVIVCGTFIFLVADPKHVESAWGLRAWMVVVIVGRELLVTALRSFIEDRGSDFSAKMSGKLKMVLQCIAAGTCLFYLYLAYENPETAHAPIGFGGSGPLRVVFGCLDGLLRPGLHPRRGAAAARRLVGFGTQNNTQPLAASHSHRQFTTHAPRSRTNSAGSEFVLAIGACAAVWAWVAMRWRLGLPLLPYQPRRPVPWRGVDVLLILMAYYFFPQLVLQVSKTVLHVPAASESKSAEKAPDKAHAIQRVLSEKSKTPWPIVVSALLAILVAPITEEMVFRLLLQGWFESDRAACSPADALAASNHRRARAGGNCGDAVCRDPYSHAGAARRVVHGRLSTAILCRGKSVGGRRACMLAEICHRSDAGRFWDRAPQTGRRRPDWFAGVSCGYAAGLRRAVHREEIVAAN